MSTLTIILITIWATFALLVIIGSFINDKEQQEKGIEKPKENDLLNFKKEQSAAFKALSNYAPSVIRNSIMMLIVQVIALSGALLGLYLLVFYGMMGSPIDTEVLEHKYFMLLLLAVTVVMYSIYLLAKMVRRRNKYIIELEELLRK